jgi:hypothetical protein
MHTTIETFIVRETEKAVAVVSTPVTGPKKPMWVPRAKISEIIETDGYSPSIQLAGEKVRRLAIPALVTINSSFLTEIGEL